MMGKKHSQLLGLAPGMTPLWHVPHNAVGHDTGSLLHDGRSSAIRTAAAPACWALATLVVKWQPPRSMSSMGLASAPPSVHVALAGNDSQPLLPSSNSRDATNRPYSGEEGGGHTYTRTAHTDKRHQASSRDQRGAGERVSGW